MSADRFAVDPEKCIACDACANDFPDIFEMFGVGDDRKARSREGHEPFVEKVNARKVVDICPTAAIGFSGELPPPVEGEDLVLEPVEGWEAEWQAFVASGRDEDPQEFDRRYGRDYELSELEPGHFRLLVRFARTLPPTRDSFKFGLGRAMPRYETVTTVTGRRLYMAAKVGDPKVRAALCNRSAAFPDRFTVAVDLPVPPIGIREHLDSHGLLEMHIFTEESALQAFEWHSHFITDLCTGCGVCEKVCPTNAITGDSKHIHHIEPKLCINCSVCGVYCPFDAITGRDGEIVQRIKPKQIPKAEVIEELCTGCEYCVDVCPFDCIELVARNGEGGHMSDMLAVVDQKSCVSCKLCEQVCMKNAIVVNREHQFDPQFGWSFQAGAV
ncbi:MAG: 4Fe-4S dicluster domain-containing protein [Planctomycetota bacterium]|nr:MAG: 4Fe-4S dicluster domain-containing protein [Planctomycetota bacterium]